MSTKNKIPVALDRSNINALFGLVGGYGTVVTVGIIAVLSVCAAFFIYRSFQGKRSKDCEKKVNESGETEGESPAWGNGQDDDPTLESTEGSDDGGSEDFESDSSEAITLSTADTQLPSDLSVKDLGETTQDHPVFPIPEVMHESDVPESIKVQPDLHEGIKPMDNMLEVQQKEKELHGEDESDEAEPHGDADEPSETESAQEMTEARNIPADKAQLEEDLLDSAVSSPEAESKLSEEELVTVEPGIHVPPDRTSCPEVNGEPMEDLEASSKELEKCSSDCLVPRECDRSSLDLPSSNSVSENGDDPEVRAKSYRGFGDAFGSAELMLSGAVGSFPSLSGAVGSFPSLSGAVGGYDHLLASPPLQCFLGFARPSLVDAKVERTAVGVDHSGSTPAIKIRDKNEINIMEAIMDSNEWLSTGPTETRDLPWLTQTQSNAIHRHRTNTSSLTATATPDSESSSDINVLNLATTNKSHEEEEQSHRTVALTVTPDDDVVRAGDDEEDVQNKRVAAVSPMPQLVQVSFRVHYVTWFPSQLVAVTGSLRELGAWDSFVPLQRSEGGFWAGTVALPAESHAEWKFILVEDGKVRRWEECVNRHLVVIGQEGEEIHLEESWGFL